MTELSTPGCVGAARSLPEPPLLLDAEPLLDPELLEPELLEPELELAPPELDEDPELDDPDELDESPSSPAVV
tara:strand:+ start:894 stop:1112 length:219 start_codon:yes stop_codon:yes gene_type:complete